MSEQLKRISEIAINTAQKDMTLRELKESVESCEIITDPDYQRKYVYDNKRASKLVESILLDIPIPIIYLCEENDGTLSVIDGQQRIISFVNYLGNKFQLVGLTSLPLLNGLYFKDLEHGTQMTLRTKTLKVITIKRDSAEMKYEIFARLNLGAVTLKGQELRNCVYRGTFNDMLKDVAANNGKLKIMFHDENTRGEYEERILRFFTLRDYRNVKGTYKNAMNDFMMLHQHDDETIVNKYRQQYNSTIDLVKQVLGNDAFFSTSQNKRRKFNCAIYDSIMIAFSYYKPRIIMNNADAIREAIGIVKTEDKEYQENVYVGTNAGFKVRLRIEKIMNAIDKIVGNSENMYEPRIFDAKIKKQLYYPGYKCSYCGNEILAIEDCEIDHAMPHSKGGATNIGNAQLLHGYCNKVKGNSVKPKD